MDYGVSVFNSIGVKVVMSWHLLNRKYLFDNLK